MNACPDIDDLLGTATSPSTRSHAAQCEACGAVLALAAARAPRRASRALPSAACAEFEPAIAAMVEGTIHRLELGRLVEHLGECGICSDVASRLTLLRSELDDIPEPRAPRVAAAAATAATGRSREETTVVSRPPTANGAARDPISRLGRRLLVAVVPPPTHRLAWAAQIALVALATWGVTRSIRDRAAPIEAAHDRARSVEVAPAGGPEVARAVERALKAELRAQVAEEQARDAEQKLAETEKRVGELERQLHPDKHVAAAAPPKSSATPDVTDPFADSPPAPASTEEAGFLTIVCTPFCDDVVDGGRSLGPSPIVHLAVKPGQHRITLKARGGRSRTIVVTIVAGQVTAQRVSMKTGAQPLPDDAFDSRR